MTKHKKELQRYYVKWTLIALIVMLVISGLVGYFIQIKDNTILMVMLGEAFMALATFFGFSYPTKVSEDKESEIV